MRRERPRFASVPTTARLVLAVACGLAWAPVAASAGAEPAAQPRNVGVVVYPGYVASEVVGPYVVFARAAKEPALAGLRVWTVGPSHDPVRSSEGLRIVPDTVYAEAPRLDLIVVPAGDDIGARMRDSGLVGFLKARGAGTGATVVGVCSGVQILGAAGLLDGRRATTFPGGEGALQRAWPKARVVGGKDIVVDGPLVTVSGELVAWRAALDVVARWAGPEVAKRVSDGLFLDELTRIEEERGLVRRAEPALVEPGLVEPERTP